MEVYKLEEIAKFTPPEIDKEFTSPSKFCEKFPEAFSVGLMLFQEKSFCFFSNFNELSDNFISMLFSNADFTASSIVIFSAAKQKELQLRTNNNIIFLRNI
jgi:hypothetical protein